MKAIPKITVRIDRGEDFVELCGDWQDSLPPMCGKGDSDEWIDYHNVVQAWETLNKAVME